MNDIVLTIAIPTYNRPEAIRSQVRCLIPQLTEKVQLVVYDNCSLPPVSTLFLKEELEKITLIRNSTNVGADANIARCFENCETQWLWTLSDDDLVKDNVVDYLLKILESSDTIFFNFQLGLSFQSIGFKSLALRFQDPNVFSSSFTMSSCIYNMGRLKPSLIDYYSNLSSMVGTIILVLKYVEKNDSAKCEFIDYSLINSYNNEVGWDYRVFIKKSILFVYAFRMGVEKNIKFNKTLFLGYFLTNYWLIGADRNRNKVSKRERLKLLSLNIRRQGIFNVLLYCPKIAIRTLINICFK